VTDDTPLPLAGPSVTMRALAARAEELRRDVTRPVLLVGARGLGKQFLAQRIHLSSSLSAKPLIAIDARRQTADALRRVFDDATPGSTLLVRHVELLPMAVQQLLDQRSSDRKAIARVMATATGDVVARVTAGLFLESLYYRLHAWPMQLPSLAERETDDLLALSEAVLLQTGDTDADLPLTLDAAAIALLAAHDWPDNLRELEATLALAQLRARGETAIGAAHLASRGADDSVPAPDASIADMERWHMLRALAVHKGNRTHAARSLGVSRMTLITKLKLFHDEVDV
jgi:two-component system, response regulator FlrC